MVRLKGMGIYADTGEQHYFNSTMVRLKDGFVTYYGFGGKFQFHYGSIKRQNVHRIRQK